MPIKLADTAVPSTETFPVAKQNHIKGGAHVVSSQTTWETELPTHLRVAGGTVYVLDEQQTYEINADLDELLPTSGTSGIFVSRDGVTYIAVIDGEEVEVFDPVVDASEKVLRAIDTEGRLLAQVLRFPSGGGVLFGTKSSTFSAEEGESFSLKVDGVWTDVVVATFDAYGEVAVAIDDQGRFIVGNMFLADGARFATAGAEILPAGDGWHWGATDRTGKPLIGIPEGGTDVEFLSGQSSMGIWIETQNAKNLAASRAITAEHNARVARFEAGASLILSYGQSLNLGSEGFPALNTTPVDGCVMIGESVRSQFRTHLIWEPIGTAALNPLVATTDSKTNPRTVLDSTAVAALDHDTADNDGEAPLVGMVMGLARRFKRRGRSMPELCGVVSGVGGRTIFELSKGADPELFNQIPTSLAQFTTLETAAGRSSEVTAMIYLQGENDYGDETTQEDYKAALETLWADAKAEIVAATGQSFTPTLFIYQTSSHGVYNTPSVAVGMAQWEFSLENDDVVMVGPVYPYPKHSVHLFCNGYRQIGEKFAEVSSRFLLDGRQFEPLSPLWTDCLGADIYVGFHVPVPPLQFADYYVFSTLTEASDYPSKGFRVYDPDNAASDGSGWLEVTGAEIVSDTILKLTCAATPTDEAVLFGSRNSYGGVHLADSSTYAADGDYLYEENAGHDPSEDIAALIDQPYDQKNWCIGFAVAAHGFKRSS